MGELVLFSWWSESLTFPCCSFFLPQLPAQSDLVRQALREIIPNFSGSISRAVVPFEINHSVATSAGLPLTINVIMSAIVAASLHGNISVQLFILENKKKTNTQNPKKPCFHSESRNITTSERGLRNPPASEVQHQCESSCTFKVRLLLLYQNQNTLLIL